jgi:hypothetical protein
LRIPASSTALVADKGSRAMGTAAHDIESGTCWRTLVPDRPG